MPSSTPQANRHARPRALRHRLLAHLGAAAMAVALGALWTSSAAAQTVVRLDIDGTINPAVDAYLRDGLAHARDIDAELILIRLDTPGGLVDTTRTMVMQMLGANVPIVVWVGPQGARAASAGVFITMAAHVATMAPGTHIGAATPVTMGGGQESSPTNKEGEGEDEGEAAPASNQDNMQRKMLQDTRAFARAIAEARGRPSAWIESTVIDALSFTAEEALAEGAIDFIATSEAAILAELHGRTVVVQGQPRQLDTAHATVEPFNMTLGQRILHILAHPTLAYLLLLFGVVAIYFELSNPGGYIAGALGAVALILAIIAFQVMPFQAGALVLVFLGLGLIVAEAFLPAGGALAIGGSIGLIAGGLLLFDTPALTFKPSPWAVVSVGVAAALMALLAGVLVARTHRSAPALGPHTLIGRQAKVLQPLRPEGKVSLDGEIWNARLAQGEAGQAASVTIVAVEGLTLHVAPQDEPPPPET